MKFDLHAPCSNCPFLKKGGARLRKDRIRQIAGAMLSSQGATFACHKTTIESDDEEGFGKRSVGPETQHCAGALIFAEKHENATQMMRIAERLRMYDPRKLAGYDRVFDSLSQMLRTAA